LRPSSCLPTAQSSRKIKRSCGRIEQSHELYWSRSGQMRPGANPPCPALALIARQPKGAGEGTIALRRSVEASGAATSNKAKGRRRAPEKPEQPKRKRCRAAAFHGLIWGRSDRQPGVGLRRCIHGHDVRESHSEQWAATLCPRRWHQRTRQPRAQLSTAMHWCPADSYVTNAAAPAWSSSQLTIRTPIS
jgi:hypothetical protein